MEKIKYLEYAAWTYFGLSVLGGFFLMYEIGFAIGFAVILQSVVVAGFLLVFCDMASNITAVKNKLAGVTPETADANDIEVVKKEEF